MTLVPKRGAKPRVIGPPSGQVVSRGLTATWRQHLDTLDVDLQELRLCETVLHKPVVRVERIDRRAGGGLYWEYGLGAVLGGLGIAGLIRPQFLSNSHVTSEGNIEKDLSSGYRLAGIALGVGVIALTSGIIDSVRARDEVRYTDAFTLEPGQRVPCANQSVALADYGVTLIVEDWRAEETTDGEGKVSFLLPPEPDGVGPEESLHKGVLTFERDRAVAVDFIAPYALTAEDPHTGEITVAPE